MPWKACRIRRNEMSLLRVSVNSSDHVQGPDNALVTLLEYGDYECPHCGRAHHVVQRVQRDFGLRVRLAYRHFPLTEIHHMPKQQRRRPNMPESMAASGK